MEVKKVYLAKTIDGKDRILFKSLEKWNGLYYKVFMDLETKEKFTENYIDLLIPYNNLSNKVFSSKRNIINNVNLGNETTYHVDNLFVGDISKVEWVSNDYMSVDCVKSDVLFLKSDDECKDILTGKTYKIRGNKELKEEDICVSNLRNIKDVIELDSDIVNKNYVLTKRYEYNKEK